MIKLGNSVKSTIWITVAISVGPNALTIIGAKPHAFIRNYLFDSTAHKGCNLLVESVKNSIDTMIPTFNTNLAFSKNFGFKE